MAQPAAPPPDVRRDPFSQAAGQIAQEARYAAIVDKGPLIDIPKEKKRPTGLIIGISIVAVVALGIGYAFGGVMHARKVFNKTVEDAARIKGAMGKLADVTKKVIDAVNEARGRNKTAVIYDEKLIDALRQIQSSSPLTNVENAKKIETQIFRTNYALMDDLLIARMFKYFNNSLRLMASLDTFVEFAEKNKDKIKAYLDKAKEGTQNYGLFLAMDKGKYFIGGLAQISQPVCQDRKPWNNRDCQLGFLVSTGGKDWSWRPGKPDAKTRTKVGDIVVPLPPNDAVLSGLTGKPGRMIFSRYVILYRTIEAIAALLHRDIKAIKQDLGKQAGRQKVFTL